MKSKIESAFEGFPWDFNAHHKRVEVSNLEAPVNLLKQLPSSEEATSLYKSFAEAIYENDLSEIKDQLEPKFAMRVKEKVQCAHDAIKARNLRLRLENMRG